MRVRGGVGFDNEREQFRVLFPAFLRRLFENDLVPETVDLRQSALWLAALLTIPPAIFAITLSLFYGSWMTDERLALRSVPHKLYFIGYSMAAVGLLTVLVWNALFPDRRDAMLLGGLPIRTRTVVVAKLSALVAFVVGFAVVINTPATVLFSLVAGGYLPFGAFVRYPVAHFITTRLRRTAGVPRPCRAADELRPRPSRAPSAARIDARATAVRDRADRMARLRARPAGQARHPVEQAIVAFAARSLARSRPHRLLVAAYGGLGLALVIGSFLSPVTGIAESALSESLSTPSVRLLSIPFVLSFFILVALRVLFTVPTEIDANRVFRMTEIDDKAVYLSGSRKAMWLLGALPIAVVTLPACAWLWGPALALGHTVFWLLMAGGLTELLLYRFHKVPFACGYVPGKANVKYLWPVYALVLTAYAYWTARLELWILADPVRWSIGCATLGTCLALAIAYRRRMLRSSNPLTYEEEVEAAVQVLGVMRT